MLIKQKNFLSLPGNLTLTICKLLTVFSPKVNLLLYLLYLPLFNDPQVLFTALDCLWKTILRRPIFIKLRISWPILPSKTTLKMENSCTSQFGWQGQIQPWIAKGVWHWLHSGGGSEELWALTFIQADWTLQYVSQGILFSTVLEVPNCDTVLQNLAERSTAKNYHPVNVLSVVSKIFEKLKNDRFAHHLEKCSFFSDFQFGFKSFWSTADLATLWDLRSSRTATVFSGSTLCYL